MVATADWLYGYAAAWRPPPKLSLSAWADEHFRLSGGSADAGRWRTRPYQREILDALVDPAVERVSVIKSARIGWALAIDTPLPTPTGWTTMGDVDVGDMLLADDGSPCRVTGKSQVHTDHQCYRIRFCDGSEIIADAGHRWAVESDVSLEHLAAGRIGRTGRPGPGAMRTFRGVIDTATMARAMRTSRGRTALAVANAVPLQLPEVELPVPPYTLGLWLGDGNSNSPQITQHRSDAGEVAGYILEDGIVASVRYVDDHRPDNATIFLDVPDRGRAMSPWARVLRRLGIIDAKAIPPAYLRASFAQRLALLRGLMDSDGTVSLDGRAEFVNTNHGLALAVYELAVSLGCKASLRPRAPQREGWQPQWRVNFKPVPDVNPFRLRRKAARVLLPVKPSITRRRRVVAVDPIASQPVQCVEVDSGSHLFLAGRQMVPTHNTEMVKAATSYFMTEDPCPILGVLPTVEIAEIFSREMLAPMLRDVPVLASLIQGPAVKATGRTLLHKSFPGGVISLVGANSAAGFSMLSRRLLWLDEVDRMPPSAGDEGDPVALAVTRTKTFWNRKILAGSTPTIAGVSRIAELFDAGDQRRYYVPCPTCGHMDFLVFRPRPDGRGHAMSWPDDHPELACFECSAKGCPIEERDKQAMIEAGEWRADAQFIKHASFSIWTAYSSSPNAGWGQIATEFIEAKRLGHEKLRVFVNTVLGETWQERGEAPEWERLYQRRESYATGTIPAGVIVVTAGVDVQKDRLVVEVVGWAANKESWSIEWLELHGDTALLTGPGSPWVQLDEALDRTYVGSEGRIFAIARTAVDAGWQTTAANTQTVYAWGRTKDRSRVMVTKGVPGSRALVDVATPVDVTIGGKRIQRGYRVWAIGVDGAKGELYGWLRLEHVDGDPPPGFCHFPEHPTEYFKQLTAEHLMTHVNPKTKVKRLAWEPLPNRQNHVLDARILARVAAAVLGIDRMSAGPRAATGRGPAAAPGPAGGSGAGGDRGGGEPGARAAAPAQASSSAATRPSSSYWSRPRGGAGPRGSARAIGSAPFVSVHLAERAALFAEHGQ